MPAKASGRQRGYWNGDPVITNGLKCIQNQLSAHFKQMWLSPRVTHNNPYTLRSQLIWHAGSWAWRLCVSGGFSDASGKQCLPPKKQCTACGLGDGGVGAIVVMKYEAAWLHNQRGLSQTRATSHCSSSHHSSKDSAKKISYWRHLVAHSFLKGSSSLTNRSWCKFGCLGSICRCVILIIGWYHAADVI